MRCGQKCLSSETALGKPTAVLMCCWWGQHLLSIQVGKADWAHGVCVTGSDVKAAADGAETQRGLNLLGWVFSVEKTSLVCMGQEKQRLVSCR